MSSQNHCFIHIGTPKTGSTAIQQFLFENREVLRERAMLYPNANLRGYGHHDLAFLLSAGYPDWALQQPKPLTEIAAELRASVTGYTGSIVLSSENFYLFPAPAALRTLLDATGAATGRQVAIIVYLRRQDDAHESWYNQTIKTQGETHDVDACVERWRSLWDYEMRLQEWAATFGEANIVVRPYENSQFLGGSLIADFLDTVGVDRDELALPCERTNTSLNRDMLEFQRLVNRLPMTPPEKRRFFRQLIALTQRTSGSGLFDESPVLDAPRRAEIRRYYEPGNVAVAEKYLGRSDLFFDWADRGVTTSTTWPGLTVEKLVSILGWLMAGGGADRENGDVSR